MHDSEHQSNTFTVLPLCGTSGVYYLRLNSTTMIIEMLFIAGALLIGGAAWLAVLFEQAPCGFQCDKHGYLHGKLNTCPKCGVAIFRRGSGFSPQV
jgi:hypothetical protein